MRPHLLPVLLLAACGSPSGGRSTSDPDASGPPKEEKEAGIAIDRQAKRIEDDRPVPKPTQQELEDFARIWELYRAGDPRWGLERDRFERRSDAAAYLLAGHLLQYYMALNAERARAGRKLVEVKNEIVAVGEPCAPFLVNLMVLDAIPLSGGREFLTDDLTRQDCLDMLERMGPQAVPELLAALARRDLSPKGRRLTALALGGTQDPRAFDPLVRLLKEDESWQVRADAATALGKLGDRRAARPLYEAMKEDSDPAVRERATATRRKLLVGGA